MADAELNGRDTDWLAVKADYESGYFSYADLCVKYHVTRSAVESRIRTLAWSRRRPREAQARRALLARLFQILETKAIEMESQMSAETAKEIELLGHMAKTLEKLMELDAKQRKPELRKPQSREMQAIRAKLAKRMQTLGE